MKNFKLTSNTRIKFGRTLYQIEANISFGTVKKGDLGGWVEKEESIVGENVWLYPDAEVFRFAKIHAGVIWGGVIRGGEIWGGVIHAGVIWGGEIWKTSDYIAFCSIGSEGGVLTAYINNGEIECTRGCFKGTLAEFKLAVRKRHKSSKIAKEYKSAISMIEARFSLTIRKKKAS